MRVSISSIMFKIGYEERKKQLICKLYIVIFFIVRPLNSSCISTAVFVYLHVFRKFYDLCNIFSIMFKNGYEEREKKSLFVNFIL